MRRTARSDSRNRETLNLGAMHFTFAQKIFDEMAALSPNYNGISDQRLEHQGTKFLHQRKFGRGLGLFTGIAFRPSEELPDADYPLYLTTGRRYAHYNARSVTGRCPTLHNEYSKAIPQMHVRDAENMGLRNGDQIKVISRRRELKAKLI